MPHWNLMAWHSTLPGNLYIVDGPNNAVRKGSTNGVITTVAGVGGTLSAGYSGDGGPVPVRSSNTPLA